MDFILNTAGLAFIAFLIYAFVKDMRRSLLVGERRRNAEQRIRRIRLGLEPCGRCGGSGYLPQFSHVENGICFLCHGYSKHGRYGSLEAAKRRHEEAIKARNEPPVPRSKYLEKRARYYELFSTYHLKCILGKCSESEKQDDEIAVIQMVLKNKLQTAQDQSNSEE